jgi:predicted GNAT family acetyltransferase
VPKFNLGGFYTMKKSFDITVSDELRNETEAKFYETEVSARNAAIALARSDDANDPFNSAFGYNWERLVKFAKEYEDQKEIISETVVKPELKKRGLTADVSWNLNFDTKTLTVTYDDELFPEEDSGKTRLVIDCPDEYVAPVASASATLNAYDTIIGYISRNNGAGISNFIINELEKKHSVAYKEFIQKRQDVEDNVVQKYLGENSITERVTWELKYSTKKITITY